MKNTFTLLRTRGAAMKTAIAGAFAVPVLSANAALPEWATTAAADLGGSVGDFEGLVGPIILGVVVALVGIKLFKRFTSKI